MPKFIQLTVKGFTGKKHVTVNVDHIQTVTPQDQGTEIRFSDGHKIDADERYQEVLRVLYDGQYD